MSKRAKRIEIVNSGSYENWYNKIACHGCQFEVTKEEDEIYTVLVGGSPKGFRVMKKNCKVIEYHEPTAKEWCEENGIEVGSKIRHKSWTGQTFVVKSIEDDYIKADDVDGELGYTMHILEKITLIKPEYRPCETFEEAVEFVGCVIKYKNMETVKTITGITNGEFELSDGYDAWEYSSVYELYTRLDGSPIGVKL